MHGDYNMMRNIIDGSITEEQIKKRVHEKLNPEKLMKSSVFDIGKLVSMNGDMGRMLNNFKNIKNAKTTGEFLTNVRIAGESRTIISCSINKRIK